MKQLTDDQQSSLNSGNKILKFSAVWCGPCRQLGPIMDEVETENTDPSIEFFEVDCDTNSEICAKFGIRNIPTVLYIKDGVVVDKSIGLATKTILTEKISVFAN